MSVSHPLASDINAKLAAQFERQVLEAAMHSLDQETNPLRLNHFATTLRELSRLVLHRLAPDAEVKACAWYVKPPDTDITRGQRITYAVQAGLLDSFVINTLQLDVAAMRKELMDCINELSKYTHIGPTVFGVSGAQLDNTVTESLEAFLAFLEMIEECRESVERAVESHAREALNEELIRTSRQELDQLATHHIVYGVNIETVNVRSIDAAKIQFDVTGSVDCQLQYGSSSDVRNGDGLQMDDSYPLVCEFESSTAAPLTVALKPHSLTIDTDSFYA